MTNNTVSFVLSETAAIALNLDERGMYIEEPTLVWVGRRVRVTATLRTAKLMLSDALDRSGPYCYAWDQPSSWKRACKTAAERITAALNEEN